MQERLQQSATIAERVLAPLSHPTRLLVVCLLIERERHVGSLLEELGGRKANLSQHLRLLEMAGLVASRKEANRVYYRIADPRLRQVVLSLQRLYCPGLTSPACPTSSQGKEPR